MNSDSSIQDDVCQAYVGLIDLPARPAWPSSKLGEDEGPASELRSSPIVSLLPDCLSGSLNDPPDVDAIARPLILIEPAKAPLGSLDGMTG